MPPKLGILAGRGDLPAQMIETCRKQQREFVVVAFEGQTEAELVREVPHHWFPLGAVGKTIRYLKDSGAKELVLAGAIKRPSFFTLKPDAIAAKWLTKLSAKKLAGDDQLLSLIVTELEKEGFSVIGTEDVLGEQILAPEGILGAVRPDAQAEKDIAAGMEIAKEIGRMDIGQAVVVQNGVVIGVEAVEGTDALLERCGRLTTDGPGGVLVKMRKPQQEQRADLPTIGLTTIENAAKAGLQGIAVEAEGAIIVNREQVAAKADALGLYIIGIRGS